jgi:hypothetical protein
VNCEDKAASSVKRDCAPISSLLASRRKCDVHPSVRRAALECRWLVVVFD